ncbi:hypothetical protein Ciccas_010925, partial [Cichlidogyrus casuarinus]
MTATNQNQLNAMGAYFRFIHESMTRLQQHPPLELSMEPCNLTAESSMKDSGLGTTKGTLSSGPSSTSTSPESTKEAGPKEITTSTPARDGKLGDFASAFRPPDNKMNLEDVLVTPVMKRRSRQMHPCEYCDKQFDRPSLLKRHTLTHTGERPFACKYCGKGFSTRSGVNTHERTHTGQRPYVCRICGRRFAAGSNLIFHKYTHTNDRKHACTMCPKAFLTPGDLRKHEYTHTGEWPFRCSICEKGFATERNLNAHILVHSAKKPFVCPVCHRGYAQESTLKNHMKQHSTEDWREKVNGLSQDATQQQTNSVTPIEQVQKSKPTNSQKFLIENLIDDAPIPVADQNPKPNLAPIYE